MRWKRNGTAVGGQTRRRRERGKNGNAAREVSTNNFVIYAGRNNLSPKGVDRCACLLRQNSSKYFRSKPWRIYVLFHFWRKSPLIFSGSKQVLSFFVFILVLLRRKLRAYVYETVCLCVRGQEKMLGRNSRVPKLPSCPEATWSTCFYKCHERISIAVNVSCLIESRVSNLKICERWRPLRVTVVLF